MSEKKITADNISGFVNTLALSKKQNKDEYRNEFYYHLTCLLTFYLAAMRDRKYKAFRFNETNPA